MSWLPLVLQFLPAIIDAISKAVSKPPVVGMAIEEHDAKIEALKSAHAALAQAHEHLTNVKI